CRRAPAPGPRRATRSRRRGAGRTASIGGVGSLEENPGPAGESAWRRAFAPPYPTPAGGAPVARPAPTSVLAGGFGRRRLRAGRREPHDGGLAHTSWLRRDTSPLADLF